MKSHAALTVLCLSLLSAVLPETGRAADRPAAPRLTLGACTDPALPKDARCGTYKVFENRAAKKGRKISLRVVVLPALGPERMPDAVVFFSGGPGASSIQEGVYISTLLAPLRQHRDFLLVDARGTGGSSLLGCPEFQGTQEVQGLLDNFLPTDKVRACHERLSKAADLAQYTTDNTVDDIEEVRAALGYPQLNLIGGSYGTRPVLVYLRRHPDRVRTAILDGTVPTHDRSPLFYARSAQRALDGLVAECAGDADCARAFPHLRDEIAAVLARAERDPARVRLTDPRTGKPYEVRLSRAAVAQALRFMLYDPSSAAELPLRVHLAAEGNWKPLAGTAISSVQGLVSMGQGYFLGVTCSEDVPFIRDEEIPAAVAGTFLGDFRIRRQRAACAEWTAAKIPESFLAPVTSDVPALILAGELDPVTPSSDGERVARTLRHSKYVFIPDAGHGIGGFKGQDCINALQVKTIEDGSVDRLDTSCVAKMERPAFVLSQGDPEVAVSRADLEALVGRYAGESAGPVKVVLRDGRLRMEFVADEAVFLVPTAATRFRPEGWPAGYAVRFERDGQGPATAMTLVKPGQPDQRMTRKP
jgi:pimeloyl-ACP methyl ester carboxylesterase